MDVRVFGQQNRLKFFLSGFTKGRGYKNSICLPRWPRSCTFTCHLQKIATAVARLLDGPLARSCIGYFSNFKGRPCQGLRPLAADTADGVHLPQTIYRLILLLFAREARRTLDYNFVKVPISVTDFSHFTLKSYHGWNITACQFYSNNIILHEYHRNVIYNHCRQ